MLKKAIYSFVPGIIWLLTIVVGSFMSASKVPSVAISDKGIHKIIMWLIIEIIIPWIKTMISKSNPSLQK